MTTALSRFPRILLLVGGLFALSACESGEALFGTGGEDLTAAEMAPSPIPSVNGRREWSGAASAAAIDMTVVVKDERGWQILWQLAGDAPPGAFPAGGMAVAVFLGPRPTGGYSVDIPRVRSVADRVVVDYVESFPAPDMAVAQVITAPYSVEIVRNVDLPVQFNRLDPMVASTQVQMEPVQSP